MSCCIYIAEKMLYFIIIAIVLTTIINPSHLEKSENYVLIDCDTGIDDAQALIMAIKAHQSSQIKIVGITCVNGNTKIDNCLRNVGRVLQLFNITEDEIPILKGAVSPLVHHFSFTRPPYHGEDGLGDANWPIALSENNKSETGVSEIIRLAKLYQGQLTIIALGPLTNIALAIKLESSFKSLLKELVVMGGNIHGIGNIHLTAEFNFYVDPEAAFVVLNDIECPIKIITLEICIQNYFSCDWRINTLGNVNSPEGQFINKIEKNLLENTLCKNGSGVWGTFDQLAVGVFLNPILEEESKEYYSSVELEGTYTRGMMVVDYRNHTGLKSNMKIVTKVNKMIYENMLKSMFGHVHDDN